MKQSLSRLAFSIVFISFISLINSYVFMKLWNWLIVPIFHTSLLTQAQSWAVIIVVAYLKTRRGDGDNKEGKEWRRNALEEIQFWIIYGAFALLLAKIAAAVI